MASCNLKEKNGNFYAVISKRDESAKSGYKNVWIPLGKDREEAARMIDEHHQNRLNLLDRFAIPTPPTGIDHKRRTRKVIMLYEMIDRYLDFLSAHRNIRTRQTYASCLKDFSRVYLHRDINIFNITTDMMEDYVADLRKRGRMKDTVVQNFRVVGRMFKWMKKKNYVDFNPCDEAEKPKIDRNRLPKFLTEEQIAYTYEIINQSKKDFIRQRDHLLFTLLLKTGLRNQEACDLTWERIDLVNRRLFVKKGKLDRDGWIPLSNGLIETLQNYNFRNRSSYVICTFSGGRMNACMMFSIFAKWNQQFLKKYPETRLHPHLLRHTFASMLARRGMPIQKVQLAMRHKIVEMTMRYAHLSPDSIQQEINVVD